MAPIVRPWVSAADRGRLEAIVADRNRSEEHLARARILFGGGRAPAGRGGRAAGPRRPAGSLALAATLRRSRHRRLAARRQPQARKAPLGAAMAQQVVALTCAERLGEAAHWAGRAMAKATGISLRSVQRIWSAHDLQPHRIRTFKRSYDPEFAAKLADIVGV
jgi:hypothetical protein